MPFLLSKKTGAKQEQYLLRATPCTYLIPWLILSSTHQSGIDSVFVDESRNSCTK